MQSTVNLFEWPPSSFILSLSLAHIYCLNLCLFSSHCAQRTLHTAQQYIVVYNFHGVDYIINKNCVYTVYTFAIMYSHCPFFHIFTTVCGEHWLLCWHSMRANSGWSSSHVLTTLTLAIVHVMQRILTFFTCQCFYLNYEISFRFLTLPPSLCPLASVVVCRFVLDCNFLSFALFCVPLLASWNIIIINSWVRQTRRCTMFKWHCLLTMITE